MLILHDIYDISLYAGCTKNGNSDFDYDLKETLIVYMKILRNPSYICLVISCQMDLDSNFSPTQKGLAIYVRHVFTVFCIDYAMDVYFESLLTMFPNFKVHHDT